MRTAAANTTRSVRASILNELRKAPTAAVARARAAEHLRSPHPALDRLKVADFLEQCHRIGDKRRLLLLDAADVDGQRRIGQLGDRERGALVAELSKPWPYEQGPDPITVT